MAGGFGLRPPRLRFDLETGIARRDDTLPPPMASRSIVLVHAHPAHVRAHEVALRAVDEAAEPSYEPSLGEPHRVAKVYYTAVAKSFLRGAREMATEMGGDPDEFFGTEEIEQVGTDDDKITT